MLIPVELRGIADFTEACERLFEAMVNAPKLEILFNEEVTGGFIVNRSDGTPLGRVEITDAGCYEFIPAQV